jgi:DNA (cytosine-5)-methyltransferase 1
MPVMREVARTMMPHLDAALAQSGSKAPAKSGATRKSAGKARAAAETPRTEPAAEAA